MKLSTLKKQNARQRKGTILVLSAVLMVVMMGFIALSVDVGYMHNVQTEMDRAVDAAALAGASALPEGSIEAENVARTFVAMNQVGGSPLFGDNVTVTVGHWDRDARVFTPDNSSPSAIKVDAQRNDQRPLFFANVWGIDQFQVDSSAIALFQPRDIMVVLDYSGSMNDDSELKSINALGRTAVESNLAQIYGEMGSPTYGTLLFAPTWMNVPGATPTNSHRPQIFIEHQYENAVVRSTKPINRIKVYSGGSSKTFSGPGTLVDGFYEKEVTYNGNNRLSKFKVRSGYNDSNHSSDNRYEETIKFESLSQIRTNAKKAFNLTNGSYPYSHSGQWDKYIDYATGHNNQDWYNANKNAGYRYKFGYMNWINYLLEQQPRNSQTPDLWQTSEQPITAVKNAVDVFLNYMQTMDSGDQIGLAIYNSSSGWGKLEQGLTPNFGIISTLSRERQAAHYHNMTNIAAGLDEAREELVNNGRGDTAKRIVLMTDGVPTYPNNSSYARSLAIAAAQECADEHLPVATIALGSGADVALMEQIAEMTGGISFRVPGGRPIAEIEEDLRETFQWVASSRPLQLVSSD